MPTGRKNIKAGRGIPRKAGKRAHSYELYRLRAQCVPCGVQLRSQKGKRRHIKAHHQLADRFGPIANKPLFRTSIPL